jgi:hypothetical protein
MEAHEKKIDKIFSELGNVSLYRPPIDDMGFTTLGIEGPHLHHFTFFARVKQMSLLNHFDCSSRYYNFAIKIMISPPESYNTYEKLTLPFDADTWMYLLITFGVAFLSIFFMNFLPKMVRNIIYGENVSMPSFNVIGTFFGIGQTRLPNNNFARIVLMSFIIFCLIFRTAYQG